MSESNYQHLGIFIQYEIVKKLTKAKCENLTKDELIEVIVTLNSNNFYKNATAQKTSKSQYTVEDHMKEFIEFSELNQDS